MLLNTVFEQFVELAPMCVAARAMLELALCPEELDQLFQKTARQQCTRTLRRPKPLRDVAAGPLPGQTLVVLDPELSPAIDVVCCEDGHARERSLLDPIIASTEARDVWIADRNFCTTRLLLAIGQRSRYFIIRQHAFTLHWTRQSSRRRSVIARADLRDGVAKCTCRSLRSLGSG